MRHGEVEFAQALFPEALIAVSVLVIVLLLIPARRFKAYGPTAPARRERANCGNDKQRGAQSSGRRSGR